MLAVIASAVACTKPIEERLLSDDATTRTAALADVKARSESARRELVPVLVAKIDTTRRVASPDKKEDLGAALSQQAQNARAAQVVRERALAGLAAVGAPAVPPLVDVVSDSKQRPWVRADVAATLGEMGEVAKSAAAPALQNAFTETRDERLKLHAAAALILFGHRDQPYTDEIDRCRTKCDDELKAYITKMNL